MLDRLHTVLSWAVETVLTVLDVLFRYDPHQRF